MAHPTVLTTPVAGSMVAMLVLEEDQLTEEVLTGLF